MSFGEVDISAIPFFNALRVAEMCRDESLLTCAKSGCQIRPKKNRQQISLEFRRMFCYECGTLLEVKIILKMATLKTPKIQNSNLLQFFDVFIFEHLCTPRNKGGSENRIFGHFLHWHNFSYSKSTKPNLS